MLSLYIHVPFCVKKCHYCGFYSTSYAHQLADRFVRALEKDGARSSRELVGRELDTLYIGGGTPSALTPGQLLRILRISADYFTIAANAEWTIEANPNSLHAHDLKLLRGLGVNRLSLGIQSFSRKLLSYLGRTHSVSEAVDAVSLVRDAGFDNVNIDLIYGIPGQTMKEWEETLSIALEISPEHFSVYSLSLEEGSRFMAERVQLSDDEAAVQYETAVQMLKSAGYGHYEVSNFSLPGFTCRHNQNYWARGEYLGLGPAAWSFIGDRRYQNISDVIQYSSRLESGEEITSFEEFPNASQAFRERVMLALRTREGFCLSESPPRDQDLIKEISGHAELMKQSGLIDVSGRNIKLSERGFLLSNEVITRLLS